MRDFDHVTGTYNFSLLAVAYLMVIVGMALFYTITGIKLLKRLNASKNLGRVVRLRQVSWFLKLNFLEIRI